jgi:hypothetical protein
MKKLLATITVRTALVTMIAAAALAVPSFAAAHSVAGTQTPASAVPAKVSGVHVGTLHGQCGKPNGWAFICLLFGICT